MEPFLVGFSQTSHPRLANCNTFETVVFGFKIRQKLTSNKARKDNLVTVDKKRLIEAQRPMRNVLKTAPSNPPRFLSLQRRQPREARTVLTAWFWLA